MREEGAWTICLVLKHYPGLVSEKNWNKMRGNERFLVFFYRGRILVNCSVVMGQARMVN